MARPQRVSAHVLRLTVLLAVLPLRLLLPAAAEDHHTGPAIIPAH